MTRPVLVASVLLTLLSVGCSSGSDRAATVTANSQPTRATPSASAATVPASSPVSQSTRSHSGKAPTDADLAAVLLTVQDMPTGWAVSPPSSSASASDNTTFVGDPKCEGVYQQLEEHTALDHVGHASTEFSKGSFGPFIEEDLSSFASADVVKNELKTLKDGITACPTIKQKDADGTVTTLTASALSFPKLGDETFAVRLAGEGGGQGFSLPLTVDAVFIRTGRCGVTIAGFGIGAGPDSSQLQHAASTAVNRVSSVCS